MTTKEALKNSINYPLSLDNVLPICMKRGVDGDAELTEEIANGKGYELAYADLIRFVVTMVNLQQGGSVTLSNVTALVGTANAIYRKYDEPLIGATADERGAIIDITDKW